MIKLMKSTFYKEKETKKALCDFIMESQQLSMGEQCRRYESAFTKKQERLYSVYVANGSVANLILLQSMLNLGLLKKGDKVGFSALTWATNTMPIIQLGLVPVAIDCELSTLNISPDTLREELENIKCLFVTNVLGFADNLQEIADMCKKSNVILLEDNCESLASRAFGKLLGNFGLASTFSNFVGHHISTIEGGFVCTDDQELYEMLVRTRAHGWDRNLSPESQEKLRAKHNIDNFYAKYTFYDIATNVRPTEIQGFIGNIQIQYFDEIMSKREENFQLFHKAIKKNPDFIPLELDHMEFVSNMAMTVVCKDESTFKKYTGRFIKNEVEIRPIIAGDITQQPFYKKYVSNIKPCKNAQFVHKFGFYFPNHPELTDAELQLLIKLLEHKDD